MAEVPQITGGTLNASLLQPGLAAEVGRGPPANPLGQLQQFQGLQQSLLQNRLLGQQVQAKEALGRAVTAATDPATGQTDWNKALGLMSQDRQGAFGVPELAGQVLDRKLKELNIGQEELKLAAQRWGKVGDVSGALLATPPGQLSRDKVVKTLSEQLVGSGMFNNEDSVKQIVNFVSNLPDDDAGIRAALKGVALQSQFSTDRVNAILGQIQSVDRGPEVVNVQTSPLTGESRVTATVPKGLPPTTQVYNPQTKRMEFAGSQGAGDTGGAGLAAGPALGEAQAAQTAAQGSAQQAVQLQQRAAIVPTRQAALGEMSQLVNDFRPGPKADLDHQIGALAAQYGIKPTGVTKGAAAYETFNKLAAQVALDQWGSLGGSGSNEQLATAMRANPNATMTRMGIKNVVALLQGNEDAIAAQYQAWKKYEGANGPQSYGDFLAGWNRYYDPRAFQVLHMDPAAAKLMESRMSTDEAAKFQKSKAFARALAGGG